MKLNTITKTVLLLPVLLTASTLTNGTLLFDAPRAAMAEEAAPTSQITGVKLPGKATRLIGSEIPADVPKALTAIIKSGGPQVKQGKNEILAWAGNGYSKAKAAGLMQQTAKAMKAAGWEYSIEQPAEAKGEFTLVTAMRTVPTRKAVVGYWVPTDEVLVLAWTEMLAATPSSSPSAKGTSKSQGINSVTAKLTAPAQKRLDEALEAAIEESKVDEVKSLIKQGASAKGKAGNQTFLMRGVTRGNNEIVSALLEAGADANKGIDNGEPPIFIAALLGQIETINLLIEKGADVNVAAAESGLTALHGAAIGKRSEAIKRLLEAGADATLRDKTGKTALDIAERNKDTASIELLRAADEGAADEGNATEQ
jgi:hypothetical protein